MPAVPCSHGQIRARNTHKGGDLFRTDGTSRVHQNFCHQEKRMRLRKFFSCCIALLLCLAISAPAFSAPLTKVRTAWMDEHETFLIWYAKEKGWDKEVGLDIEILYFGSGMAILNALPAGEWVFAGMGAVPAMMGALRYNTYVIGNANEEALINRVLVRPDSPIAKVKGWNKDYPEVYGSPETVRGKTFLATTLTSSHYALSTWLNVLGLKDSDVVIKNMDQSQVVGAFENNIGDGIAIWAPHTFIVQEKGGVVFAGDIVHCKKSNPIVLIADTKYAEAHPDVAAKFLSVYMRAVDLMKNTPPKQFVEEYQKFYLEFVGKEYNYNQALLDLETHPLSNIDEQLAIFDDSKGPSQAQLHQSDIAAFFSNVGRITADEAAKVADGKYATNKYLKLLKEQQK